MRSLRARGRFGIVVTAAVASGIFAVVSACSSDAVVTAEPLDGSSTEVDSSTLPDAAEEPGDGGLDAADAAEAAARTCSDEGFCHVPVPNGHVLRGVWGDGAGVVWAVGEDGWILRWNGSAWIEHSQIGGAIWTIWGSGPTDIWLGTDLGIAHGTGPSSDRLTFSVIPEDRPIAITSIHGFGTNDVWAVGGFSDGETERSHVYHYKGETSADGPVWELDPISATVTMFNRVWGSGKDDVWLGGTTYLGEPNGGVVLRGHDDGAGGTTFEPVNVNGNFRQRFLEINGGTITADTFVIGKFWSGLPAVWFSPGPDAGVETPDGGPLLWDVDTFDTYFGFNTIWASSRSDVWVAGEFGRIRHWDGATWTEARVTITKFPFVSTIFGSWGKAKDDVWFVGDGFSIHKVSPDAVEKGGL